jgi:hypothetical protein
MGDRPPLDRLTVDSPGIFRAYLGLSQNLMLLAHSFLASEILILPLIKS